MKAWYFSNESRTLRYNDGRKIEIGVTHRVEGRPVLCEHGLHASKTIYDALQYAPGSVLWRVELSGDIVVGDDKCVAQERTYISGGVDVSKTLRRFARLCALDVIDTWDAPEIVVRYLKTGDNYIRSAAESATGSAAEYAAESAARSAARSAAESAAWYAAWYAARSAAVEKQKKRIASMLANDIKRQQNSMVTCD